MAVFAHKSRVMREWGFIHNRDPKKMDRWLLGHAELMYVIRMPGTDADWKHVTLDHRRMVVYILHLSKAKNAAFKPRGIRHK